MLLEFFLELIRGGQNSQENSCIKRKVTFEIFLGMFKALQFLRFWVNRKILQDIFLELIRAGTELSRELLDLNKNRSEIL